MLSVLTVCMTPMVACNFNTASVLRKQHFKRKQIVYKIFIYHLGITKEKEIRPKMVNKMLCSLFTLRNQIYVVERGKLY